MDHSGMDMSSTMSSPGSAATGSSQSSMSHAMNMVFTNSHDTALFSSAWTPTSGAGYAGTCIFLVLLAVSSRLLQAFRRMLELGWHDKAVKRRYIVVAGEGEADAVKESQPAGPAWDATKEDGTLTVRGVNENIRVIRTAKRESEGVPWRFSVDLPRACIFTVQGGVSYLLMLAVMTLNVGYFLSVLAGLFVGELLVGRYAMLDDGHH